MKLLSKRSALHARAELVIPWLANGSLGADAEPAVREHIAACPECREDYEEQLRVCQTMRAEGPLVFAAEPSYQKLLARIQSMEAGEEPPEEEVVELRPARAARRFPYRRSAVRWLTAAVILQGLALGLGAWTWHSSSSARAGSYATLTSASPSYEAGPRVRVLFRPDLPISALQSVLAGAGAHIVDGPGDGDVYTVGFARPPRAPGALEQRVAALRANPAVLFAEPVQEGVR